MTFWAQIATPFADPTAAALRASYPQRPGCFAHRLGAFPALSLGAIIDCAEALPPNQVELRIADTRPGAAFAQKDPQGRRIGDVIRALGHDHGWVMLRNPETLPDWRDLCDQIAHSVSAVAPDLIRPQMFLFLSSPRTHTPIHVDPEFNILFQVRGSKIFSTLPADTPWMTAHAHEKLHRDGENMLRWDDGMPAAAQHHRLSPGSALFVPYKSPHWVHAGDDVSVSLSFTWKSAWSMAHEDAWRMNARLRALGIQPSPPPAWPKQAHVKHLAERVMRKMVRR
jgi:hypothetical protein